MNRHPATAPALPVLLAIACAWVGVAPVAAAQGAGQQPVPRLTGTPLMEALRQGGYTILLRHTATDRVKPDPSLFDPDDCTTQRNLSDTGRRQAERIGRSFAKLGIQVDRVLSSPYCRCMDTGSLAFGAENVETSTLLLVGATRPDTGRNDPGVAIRKLLDTPPESGKNTVLIAHSVTLLYAFGLASKPEGVAHVFQPGGLGLGLPEYVGTVNPDDWPAYAGLDGSPESGAASAATVPDDAAASP